MLVMLLITIQTTELVQTKKVSKLSILRQVLTAIATWKKARPAPLTPCKKT